MAKRFGGRFSPDGTDSSDPSAPQATVRNAQIDPAGLRSNLMFLPAALLLLMSLNDGATGLALGLIGAGLWTLGAWLLREGMRAQAAYDARRVARRPAMPRKIFAAALAGVGAALAAWKAEPGIAIAAVYAVATAGLHIAAFGIDPMRDKGIEGVDNFQQSRVARAVDEAEEHLAAMKDAALRAQDRKIDARVEQFQSVARDLFRTVEEDPGDLTAARKYLTVYLQGARDATIKFADIYGRSRDAEARASYLALLDDLEQNFTARTAKLLIEDRSGLDIEIDVLRDRLQREGVRLDRD